MSDRPAKPSVVTTAKPKSFSASGLRGHDMNANTWFTEARYGLFIHYGLYSLLEAGEVTAAWKAALRPIQEGIVSIAREFGAPLIPLQSIFDKALALAPAAYWAYDGIHATHAGFQVIADAWLEAAERHLLLAPRS